MGDGGQTLSTPDGGRQATRSTPRGARLLGCAGGRPWLERRRGPSWGHVRTRAGRRATMTALSAAPAARLRAPLSGETPVSALSQSRPAFPFARTKLVERLMSLQGASVAVLVAPVGY